MFLAEYIEEPDLVFGHQREEKDPRIGLRYHGPYHYTTEKEPSPGQIGVGIIGDSTTLTLTKQILERSDSQDLRNRILELAQKEAERLGISRGTLSYLRKNARNEKSFKVYQKVSNRLSTVLS
jgi:hypothetical protein